MKANPKSREIAKRAFPDYKGRKFFEDWSGSVTFYDTNWGGGTRNYYTAIELMNGKATPGQDFAPWRNPVEGKTIEIPSRVVVVKRCIFQGVECGLTVYYGQLENVDAKLLQEVA